MRRKAKSAPEFFARRSHRSDGFVVAQKFLGGFSRRTGKPLTNLILRGQAMHWQTLDIRSRFGKCKKSNCSSQTLFTRTSDVFHTQKQLSRNTALPHKSNQGDKPKPWESWLRRNVRYYGPTTQTAETERAKEKNLKKFNYF